MNCYNIAYYLYFCSKKLLRYTKNKKRIFTPINFILEKNIFLCDFYINRLARKENSIFKKNNKLGITQKTRNRMIIATLTTFPARIDTVHIAIETIMAQTVKPDKILLWLASEQFSNKSELPENLLVLEKRGLEIRFCDNLLSHKKYYYSFQEYTDHLIITFDDDLLYPLDTIKKLYKLHKKYPDDIICISAMNTVNDEAIPPSKWNFYKPGDIIISDINTQAFTGAGTLFQPNKINTILYNKKLFCEVAPYADDLWLYHICKKSGIKVTRIKAHRSFPIEIYNNNKSSLFDINGAHGQNMNDVQWDKILKLKLL